MGQPVVHFEVMGTEAAKLQSYYADLLTGRSTPRPTRP